MLINQLLNRQINHNIAYLWIYLEPYVKECIYYILMHARCICCGVTAPRFDPLLDVSVWDYSRSSGFLPLS